MDIGFAIVGQGYCKDCPQAKLDIVQSNFQSFNLNEDRTLNTIYCRNEHVCQMWIEKLEEKLNGQRNNKGC